MFQMHNTHICTLQSSRPRPQGAESLHVHMYIQIFTHVQTYTRSYAPVIWEILGTVGSASQRGNEKGRGGGGACGTSLAKTPFPLLP